MFYINVNTSTEPTGKGGTRWVPPTSFATGQELSSGALALMPLARAPCSSSPWICAPAVPYPFSPQISAAPPPSRLPPRQTSSQPSPSDSHRLCLHWLCCLFKHRIYVFKFCLSSTSSCNIDTVCIFSISVPGNCDCTLRKLQRELNSSVCEMQSVALNRPS